MHGPLQLLQTQMRSPYAQMLPTGVHGADMLFASSSVGGQSPLGIGGHAPPPPSQPDALHVSVSLQYVRGSSPYSHDRPTRGHVDPPAGGVGGHATGAGESVGVSEPLPESVDAS